MAGAVAYLLGFITGIYFLFTEKRRFVRFHAMQSTILFGGLFAISLGLSIIPLVNVVWLVLSPLVGIGAFALWLWLMYQAYQGKEYKLPWVGDLSEEKLKETQRGAEKPEEE
ncbi:MAG: DUF4870 domain-containing protein [Patescibacteria group bacterium]|nr:MAG: DUF4870 domain-containing protein [Patescibacteria group bacterium]